AVRRDRVQHHLVGAVVDPVARAPVSRQAGEAGRAPAAAFSLEFFPPRTPEGVAKLAAVREALKALAPEFCSVTFGAGGSTREGTLETVLAFRGDGFVAAPHLSCIGG